MPVSYRHNIRRKTVGQRTAAYKKLWIAAERLGLGDTRLAAFTGPGLNTLGEAANRSAR